MQKHSELMKAMIELEHEVYKIGQVAIMVALEIFHVRSSLHK